VEPKMKKWAIFFVFVFLLILFTSCQKQSSENAAEPEKPRQSEKIAPVASSLERMIDTAVTSFQTGDAALRVEIKYYFSSMYLYKCS
jgi:hypothetical protein